MEGYVARQWFVGRKSVASSANSTSDFYRFSDAQRRMTLRSSALRRMSLQRNVCQHEKGFAFICGCIANLPAPAWAGSARRRKACLSQPRLAYLRFQKNLDLQHVIIINRQRRMIRKPVVFVYARIFGSRRNARRADVIVDTPTNIVFAGVAAV